MDGNISQLDDNGARDNNNDHGHSQSIVRNDEELSQVPFGVNILPKGSVLPVTRAVVLHEKIYKIKAWVVDQ